MKKVAFAFGLLAVTFSTGEAAAQAAGEFYKGKTIEIVISSSVGGGYDQYTRLISRFLPKHIPGAPAIVPKNMEGAAGLRLANWLYAVAPADGTAIGAASRAVAFEPLLGNKGAQYDGTKFGYVASANDEVSVCVIWSTAGVTRWEETLTKEIVVGSSGAGDDTYQFPTMLNRMFGARLKVVSGYPGGNEVNLAMERGEVQSRCAIPWSTVKAQKQAWIDQKLINIVLQFSLAKHADLPNVPVVTELAKTDEQRQILKLIFARQTMGRPYAVPPGVPKDRLELLRKAFMATLTDPELLGEAAKQKLEIRPVSGEQIEKLVLDIFATTPPQVAQAAANIVK